MKDGNAAPSAPTSMPTVAAGAAVLAMLFWSSSLIVGRGIHALVPPVGLSFWRTVLAVIVLFPIALRYLKTDWPVVKTEWRTLFIMGTAMWAIGNTSLFLGLHYTTALNAGIVNAAQPAIIVALGCLMYRDRINFGQALGILTSFVGVAILVIGGKGASLRDVTPHAGDLLVLIAVTCWAFYVLLIRKIGYKLHPLSLLFWVMVFGSLQLLPMAIVEAVLVRPVVPNMTTIASVFYLTLVASIAAVFCWNRAILGLGHARAAPFTHLMPLFAVILAILLLGERPQMVHAIGAAFIITGLIASTRLAAPSAAADHAAGQSDVHKENVGG